MIDWILKRRSIRRFKPGPIGDEALHAILEAAMAAPTANNTRQWEFVVLTSAGQKEALAAAHPYGKMAPQAAAVIVVVGDPANKYMEQEAGAQIENILLAASSLGLGAVWLGLNDPERQAGLCTLLNLPKNRRAVAAIPIGLPDEQKEARTQYDPTKVRYERY